MTQWKMSEYPTLPAALLDVETVVRRVPVLPLNSQCRHSLPFIAAFPSHKCPDPTHSNIAAGPCVIYR